MSISKRKSKLSSIISSYKSNHFPYTPNKDYRYELRKLATQLEPTRLHWTLEYEKEEHYCYLYLDPRYPAECEGEYTYTLPSGKVLILSHRPFYAGKGKGERLYRHLRMAVQTNKKSYKLSLIRKLEKLGLEPIVVFTSLYDEYFCFAFEVDMIAGIGRKDKKLGPLANLTDGGEGSSGNVPSKEAKNNHRNEWLSRSDEAKAISVAKQKLAWSNKSKEAIDLVVAKRKAYWAARPADEWYAIYEKRQATYDSNPKIELVRRNKLKIFQSNRSQEEKERTNNKRIATFAAKTPEERAETQRKRLETLNRNRRLRGEI